MALGVVAGEAGAEHDVGPAALLGVWHLAADQGGGGGVRKAAGAESGALDGGRGGDDEDGVHAALAAGFEQEGDVENGEAAALAAGAGEEAGFLAADQRVDDSLEAGERGGVGEEGGAEAGAVHGAALDGAGKSGGDGGDGGAAGGLEPVNDAVGVEDGDVSPAEGGGGGALTHADAAGKTDYAHWADRRLKSRFHVTKNNDFVKEVKFLRELFAGDRPSALGFERRAGGVLAVEHMAAG